jgi:hypothetical protein
MVFPRNIQCSMIYKNALCSSTILGALAALVVSPRSASAAAPDEAILYSNADATGSSQTCDIGITSPPAINPIGSVDVGSNVRVALNVSGDANAETRYLDGGWTFFGLTGPADYVRVFPRDGGPMAAWYLGADYPSDSYSWSNELQGLAHSSTSWFITQTTALWQMPLSSDLNTDEPFGSRHVGIPAELSGYDHFGDLDHYFDVGTGLNLLFVPVTSSDTALHPVIAVINADNLTYFTSAPLLGRDGNPLPSGGGWAAVRAGVVPPQLWVSTADVDRTHGFIVSDINISKLAAGQQDFLESTREFTVTNEDGLGARPDMYTMQGGTFNDTGTLLYTSNGYCDSNAWLHVFFVDQLHGTARLQGRSVNPALGQVAPFSYEQHEKSQTFGVCTGEEPEGLDFFDISGLGIPGMPDSQLHAFLLSNDAFDDQVWLKHYSY